MNKRRINKVPIAIFLIIAVVLSYSVTVFSVNDVQHSSYLERSKSLNFVMTKIGDHLNIAFETKWNRARFLSTRIERLDATSTDDLIKTLNDIYIETGLDFRAVDDEGIAYYYNGMQEYWKDHRAVSPKSETFILSPLQFGLTNENFMKYIVPLKEPLVIGDKKIMYTVFTEPLSALSKDFDTGNYGDSCLSFIIDKNGTFIYENGSGDRMADSYNFLAYVEKNVTFQYGESFEHFKENIQNGINSTVLVEYNGSNYYMSQYDLDMENWASIVLIPERNTQAEDSSFAQKVLVDIAVIFVTASILFLIGFLYMWKRTVTNQRQAAEAERRSNEAKTNFLSSMSHDIRTPMNAIIGMTEIALHNTDGVPKPVQENLEKIRLSSTHLLMLINDILDINKIESGKMSLNIAEFSIVEATNTLASLIRPLAKEKNIDLRIHTTNCLQAWLLGDELRICQVYINLATNAIKYTPNCGRVDIDFCQEFSEDMPDKVRLICQVRDNGIGMSEEYQKIMYEVFSRATDSRVNKVEGSGLGLPICRKMVEIMGGTLECKSVQDHGTTFTVTVLLDKGKPDEIYKLPNTRILVVDRDTTSTDALSHIFERLNIESDIINDPSMLIAVLEKKRSYQMAFVDLGVPSNCGIDTVQILRNRFGKNFPVVLTDIKDMVEYSDQIASTDVNITMYKPYFYCTVYQAILRALNMTEEVNAEHNDKQEKSIAGMNLLVAEDNDLNWKILYEILKMHDIKAQRAENGKECVDILNSAEVEQYAAVLMDVRMPIMNGLEATRTIRRSEKPWLKTLPIIAMTADAFSEDINECLAAGMDAHLSKPIYLNKLISVLQGIQNNSPYQPK